MTDEKKGSKVELDSSKSMLFVLTNQVKTDITQQSVDISILFNPGDKICDTLTGTTDCLTVDKDGKVAQLQIKAGDPPKIYTLSK